MMWEVFRDSVTGAEATGQTETPGGVDGAALPSLLPDYRQSLRKRKPKNS